MPIISVYTALSGLTTTQQQWTSAKIVVMVPETGVSE